MVIYTPFSHLDDCFFTLIFFVYNNLLFIFYSTLETKTLAFTKRPWRISRISKRVQSSNNVEGYQRKQPFNSLLHNLYSNVKEFKTWDFSS